MGHVAPEDGTIPNGIKSGEADEFAGFAPLCAERVILADSSDPLVYVPFDTREQRDVARRAFMCDA